MVWGAGGAAVWADAASGNAASAATARNRRIVMCVPLIVCGNFSGAFFKSQFNDWKEAKKKALPAGSASSFALR
jgi:hypothetical protein